jgi:hypothetical protein
MPNLWPSSFRAAARRRVSQLATWIALVIGLSLVATGAPRSAFALGTVKVEKSTLEEVDGRWKLKLVMDYGSQPEINFVPMLFVFTPTMLYERACTDQSKDKPIINKIPLQNQQSINEQLDVGFSDGTGKTFKETHFDFMIRRDRGFEAGEYTLEIKRASDAKTMGSKIKLVLNGNNKVVDRRAMNFVGEKKKDDPCISPPDEKAADTKPAGDAPKGDGGKKDAPPAGTEDVHADGEIPLPKDSTDAPPPVPPKQGGCGCELAAPADRSPWALGAMVGVALVVGRRLRRR